MTTTFARRSAALLACAAFGFATSAFAQEKSVTIGVLNDMSSLYADIGGPGAVAAVNMAGGEFGLPAQGLQRQHHFLYLRHLHARQRYRQGADQGRRRQLVLPDRRLRLRCRARA